MKDQRQTTADAPTEEATAGAGVAAGLALGTRMGRYELRGLVGTGGMGVVFEALDPELDRTVAVKILHATGHGREDRLRREGQTMARLTHPNVIRVYDVGAEHGRTFVAMEYVAGGTLADWLRAAPRTTREILALFVQAGRGLAAAHAVGLVHRDFKPSNVLVGADHRVLVTDFGVAQSSEGCDPDAGAVLGTPAYMAPEQLAGASVDARADQYSFCVALWTALYGAPPFQGSAEGVPAEVEHALRRGLHRDVEERHPSLAALLAELEMARIEPAAPGSVSSLAVLSFNDLSAARDQAHLCAGIADEIRAALHHVDGLRVAARGASSPFDAGSADPRLVAQHLGVDAVLAGSLQKAGDRLRFVVQLVDAGCGVQRWARRFDGALADIFAIQDQIAADVAAALSGIVAGAGAAQRPPDTTPEAYEHYLRGRWHARHFSTSALSLAKGSLERAIELDPGYAPAYARLAQLHAWTVEWYGGGAAAVAAADRASLRALELAPQLAVSCVARAAALSCRGEVAEAKRLYQRALALDPRDFDGTYLFARLCFQAGDYAQALELFRRGAELQPEDFQCMLLARNPLVRLGREEEAAVVTREGVRRAERVLEIDPDNARALSLGAGGLADLGEADRALEWLRRAARVAPDDVAVIVNGACLFSLLGRHDEALDALERSFGRGWGKRDWVENDPDYDPLRGHPRFQALLAKLS